MAEVVWTRRAIADLFAIHDYVQQFAPLAAQRLALRLRSVADSLAEQPERGRPLTMGRREIVMIFSDFFTNLDELEPILQRLRYRCRPGQR